MRARAARVAPETSITRAGAGTDETLQLDVVEHDVAGRRHGPRDGFLPLGEEPSRVDVGAERSERGRVQVVGRPDRVATRDPGGGAARDLGAERAAAAQRRRRR